VVTFATPGPLGFYVGDAANGPPTLGMVTYPVPARYARFAAEGVVLAVVGFQHARENDLLPPRVKHRSRMMWHVAERQLNDPAHRRYRPGAVPVVRTGEGYGDTPVGGVLVIFAGEAHFPRVGSVQDSITMKVAAELCARCGIPTRTLPRGGQDFTAARASEMILCGTGFGLAGVREYAVTGGVSYTYPVPGPVLTRLRAAFAEEVARVS
jgi:branched-chain amino acid aminotransferase